MEIAYSHKANRLPAILRTLAEKGIGHQVACEAEYCLARSVADADGRSIVVQGPAKPPALLDRAAADGALVIADTLAELRRLAAAGVTRVGVRVCLPGVGHGTSHFGVPMAELSMAPRHAAALGLRIEALAVHLVSAGFDRPMAEIPRLASALVVKWPQPPERFAAAAKMLAGLAVRMGVPVIDVGGGFPPAPGEGAYARAVTGAIGGAGFEGRVLVEPGRALVADAVDLAATVTAVKRLPDRRRCIVLDAGTNLLPGTLFAWPTSRRPGRTTRPPGRRSSPGRCAATSTSCIRRPTCPRWRRATRWSSAASAPTSRRSPRSSATCAPRSSRATTGTGGWSAGARRWRTSSPPTSAPTSRRPRPSRWRDGAAPASCCTATGDGGPEVLLVHPGGPFWAKKDLGAWSIPKGEYEPDEDPQACALREFEEETGTRAAAPTSWSSSARWCRRPARR